ncbi:MAG: hypothetical protein ABMA15_10925 [Vicinamibacterales bacterium]
MNEQNTHSASKTQARQMGPRGAAGHWWKAWVLLTGLAVTMLGWAIPRDERPPANGSMSSQESLSAEHSPVVRAGRIERPQQVSTSSIRTLRGMPQKPAFQAPVTRTRRS